MNSILAEIVYETDSCPTDWEELDGPETGVGIERWYRNRHSGQEVYGCDDQGDVTLSFT